MIVADDTAIEARDSLPIVADDTAIRTDSEQFVSVRSETHVDCASQPEVVGVQVGGRVL